MKIKSAIRRSHDAPEEKRIGSLWIVALAMMAALSIAAVAVAPSAMASGFQEGDVPFGLQSGLTTAHLDPSGQWMGSAAPAVAAEADLPFGLQSGLVTARGVGFVAPLHLIGGLGLPFGRQSGLATARGVGYVADLGLSGGTGLAFGRQSGLATAHLDASGLAIAGIEGGIAAIGRQ